MSADIPTPAPIEAQQTVAPVEATFNDPNAITQPRLTPAERLGLVDGLFDVTRGIGDNARTEQGWHIQHVGMATDNTTGQEREEVVIARAQVNADGSPILDDDGNAIDDVKLMWADVLLDAQENTAEAPNTAEAQAIQAVENVGSAVTFNEVQVEPVSVETLVEQQGAEAPETLQGEALKEAKGRFEDLFSIINDIASNPNRPDREQIITQAIELTTRMPAELKQAYNGALIGLIREPAQLRHLYDGQIRSQLAAVQGIDTRVLNMIDGIVQKRIGFLHAAENDADPGYAQQLIRLINTDALAAAQLTESGASDNEHAAKTAAVFLRGIAASTSTGQGRAQIRDRLQADLFGK